MTDWVTDRPTGWQIFADPRQHSNFCFLVPRDSGPRFTLRLLSEPSDYPVSQQYDLAWPYPTAIDDYES
jgi:hypothetical protein